MNRFLFKLFVLSSLFACICFGIDQLIENGIKTSSYREISKWNEVIEGGINADRLIVGSSRALVQFDPKIIEEKTGQSCYNLGIDGSTYPAQRKIVELYLEKNKKPKIIEWSIDFTTFENVEGIYRFEQFIPFLHEPKIKEILAMNQNMDLSYLNIPIARFDNNRTIKYKGLLSKTRFKHTYPLLYKGYRESEKSWNVPENQIEKLIGETSFEIDMKMFDDFIDFVTSLQTQGIEIRWVISPYFSSTELLFTNKKSIRNMLNKHADQLNIEFLDYSFDKISDQQNLFYNGTHMNKKGVSVFMIQLYSFENKMLD
ncbi:hypothetical protein LV84_04184 [Algoriphagus ratkowskyi]|uniref:GDSL-like lipase/acylhydrolase family protein n=1 Tax=Algoriphagus ratkowskyi TaxID=57028 RepID=A0A2W7SGD9_9BACT|nr:hypothetical protein [Algoriphagus ratkowskyi]PZX49792.1 hypothetical protein LV84_04184 [Algoriphagus ratkowskyi]TXD75488.1 hypothetical protein ESW18_20375 [Algoriphagus ratkowskyi]